MHCTADIVVLGLFACLGIVAAPHIRCGELLPPLYSLCNHGVPSKPLSLSFSFAHCTPNPWTQGIQGR